MYGAGNLSAMTLHALSVDLLLSSSVLLIEWNRTVMLCMGRHDFSQRKKNLLVGEHLDLSRKRMAALARTGARVVIS